jgi:hypothetical protein
VIQKQEHEMCKTKVKTCFYYVNISKHEHEKNMSRLWCKIVPKTNVEQIEGNEVLLFIPLWGLSSRRLLRRFLCVHPIKKFIENLHN